MKRSERGQSAVEFGLVVMLAILMFLGMVQFGMYLYGLSIVARMGSVSQSCAPCEAAAAARSALSGQPVIRDPSVEVLAPGGIVGSMVQIRVTAHIPMVLPGGDLFGLGKLTIVTAESIFRQEEW